MEEVFQYAPLITAFIIMCPIAWEIQCLGKISDTLSYIAKKWVTYGNLAHRNLYAYFTNQGGMETL